jgi:hypothetical protein
MPPKEWTQRIADVRLGGQRRRIRFDEWSFTASLQNDVIRVVMLSKGLADVDAPTRRSLGWFLLDGELGEQFGAEHLIELDVEDLPPDRLHPDAMPIRELGPILRMISAEAGAT